MRKLATFLLLVMLAGSLNAFFSANILKAIVNHARTNHVKQKVCKAIWDKDGSTCTDKQILDLLAKSDRSLESIEPMPESFAPGPFIGPSRRLFFSKAMFAAIAKVLALIKKASEQSRRYSAEMNSCFTYLTKAKDLNLCYACSKQKHKYYFNNKALITPQECNHMLGKCLPFFKLNFEIVAEAGSDFVCNALFGSDHKHGDVIKRLHDAIVKANIKSLIDGHDRTSGPVRQHFSDQLCLKLFRLHQHKLFKEIQQAVLLVREAAAKNNKGRKLSNWSQFSFQDYSSNPFEGDVGILNNAPHGQTISTTSGHIAHTAPHSHRPMNFSLNFY